MKINREANQFSFRLSRKDHITVKVSRKLISHVKPALERCGQHIIKVVGTPTTPSRQTGGLTWFVWIDVACSAVPASSTEKPSTEKPSTEKPSTEKSEETAVFPDGLHFIKFFFIFLHMTVVTRD